MPELPPSHSIGLSVLVFSKTSHDLMPTIISFQFKNQRIKISLIAKGISSRQKEFFNHVPHFGPNKPKAPTTNFFFTCLMLLVLSAKLK